MFWYVLAIVGVSAYILGTALDRIEASLAAMRRDAMDMLSRIDDDMSGIKFQLEMIEMEIRGPAPRLPEDDGPELA